MTENASTGLPARAPKARDTSSPVKAGDIPVERLQQVKDAVAGVGDGGEPAADIRVVTGDAGA